MRAAGIEDADDIAGARARGVIDLPTLQKKLNLHYSLSLDLFGSEVSTNSRISSIPASRAGSAKSKIADDHRLTEATYPVLKLVDGAIRLSTSPR